LNIDDSLEAQAKNALDGVKGALGSQKADAVLCVAGGWAGGNAKSDG
jgi:dihydropteridine reductase